MKSELDAEVTLLESSGGVFEVTVDGRLVSSKKGSGVFPDFNVLIAALRG